MGRRAGCDGEPLRVRLPTDIQASLIKPMPPSVTQVQTAAVRAPLLDDGRLTRLRPALLMSLRVHSGTEPGLLKVGRLQSFPRIVE